MAKETNNSVDGPIRPRMRDYSYQEHGRVSSGIPADDKTVKPGAQVEIIRPSFDGSRLVFRPLPCFYDEDKRQLEPCRLNLSYGGMSDWVRTYQVARYVGHDAKFTFIVYRPARGYDRMTNPYLILQRAISQAVYNNDASAELVWNSMITGKTKKLARPGDVTFIQAFVFEHRKKVYLGGELSPRGTGKSDMTPVVQLPPSVTGRFQEIANEVKKGYRGDPTDAEAGMVYGDLVSPKYGRFLSVYNSEEAATGTIPDDVGTEELSWDAGGSNDANKKNAGGAKGYDLEVLDKYAPPRARGFIGPSLADKVDVIRNRVQFWDDILHFPSHEEICVMMAQAFKSYPKMLQFGWSDYPEFFSSEVQGILRSRVVSGPATKGGAPARRDLEAEIKSDQPMSWEIQEEEETPAPARSSALSDATDIFEATDDTVAEDIVATVEPPVVYEDDYEEVEDTTPTPQPAPKPAVRRTR